MPVCLFIINRVIVIWTMILIIAESAHPGKPKYKVNFSVIIKLEQG